jgi:hypothetical protein
VIAIGNLEFDIAAALLSESLFGILTKLFDDFNGVYPDADVATVMGFTGLVVASDGRSSAIFERVSRRFGERA